ncbi:hypothetical protein F5Y13DRAFT_158479 [Hypoxylon sp. FL1857]|nr:hypothetical protein F5Y13DRAFT_158479 [Hypoxylon sp. FL1857]
MSLFTAVASIMRTLLVQESVGQAEAMIGVARMFLWANLETTFTIIMGCLPTLPKLFKQEGLNFAALKHTLGSFLTKTSHSFQQHTGEFPRSRGANRSGYYDLDALNSAKHDLPALTPNTADGSAPGPTTACFHHEGDHDHPSGDITRTDQFILTYGSVPDQWSEPARPREGR